MRNCTLKIPANIHLAALGTTLCFHDGTASSGEGDRGDTLPTSESAVKWDGITTVEGRLSQRSSPCKPKLSATRHNDSCQNYHAFYCSTQANESKKWSRDQKKERRNNIKKSGRVSNTDERWQKETRKYEDRKKETNKEKREGRKEGRKAKRMREQGKESEKKGRQKLKRETDERKGNETKDETEKAQSNTIWIHSHSCLRHSVFSPEPYITVFHRTWTLYCDAVWHSV